MITGNDIVEYARSWKGARWYHQARGEHNRIDCAGLLIVTARHFGLPHEDLKGYGRDPGEEFRSQIEKFTTYANLNSPLHGAIGIFHDKMMPCHTGILAVNPGGHITVIHSEAWPKRVCHEQDFDVSSPSLKDRLADIRHFQGVEYVS